MKRKHTPSQIAKMIIEGNDKYSHRHSHEYFEKIANAQNPEITLLTCADSRVQFNIFGLDATNEIFMVRNIGNQIMSVFGSVDYGILHLKTPLLLILGHSHCGAVKAVFKNYENEPFDIIRELDHLSIPIRHLKHHHHKHNMEADWLYIVEQNVDYQVKLACVKYKDLINEGSLTVMGLVDDFINIYNSGEGKIIIINVNGETDIQKLKSHAIFSELTEEMKDSSIKRYIPN